MKAADYTACEKGKYSQSAYHSCSACTSAITTFETNGRQCTVYLTDKNTGTPGLATYMNCSTKTYETTTGMPFIRSSKI
jgi:hypothetical protein